MQAEHWAELIATAQGLAPDLPDALWHEVELALRGWSVAQEAAGYTADVDGVVVYARALAELADEASASETQQDPERVLETSPQSMPEPA
jgi:hypothetical protein